MYRFTGKNSTPTFSTLWLLVLLCSPAHAYLGPGAAISSIGALLALLGAVLLAIIGFFWFPLKRMLTGRQQSSEEEEEDEKDPVEEEHEKP